MWRLMPYLVLLYVIAYLDRVNVSYAALEMTADLGFTEKTYGLGAGIFFIGYFLLEVPGAVIASRWGVRKWICRIMLTWGIFAVAMGFIQNAQQFYWLRFLIGAAEAGFFPAIIVYLGHWFRGADKAKAVAIFMSAISLAMVIGGPISGLLLNLQWFGMEGWRWLFILEGIPAIVLGITTWFFLTERPENATWLPAEEKAWLVNELDRERAARELEGKQHASSILEAIRNPQVLLFSAAYFFGLIASNGLGYWLPKMIKSMSGFTNMEVSLLVSLPYSLGVVAKVAAGWSSDRTRERRWHTIALMVVGSFGLVALATWQGHLAIAIVCLCIAVIGLMGYTSSFWAYATSFLAGTANAAAIGLINSVGNLGSFVGPYGMGWLKEETTGYTAGLLALAASAAITALLVFAVRVDRQEKHQPRG
ncbi:ACS family tartrate transporter-like MFS transporter [Roseimicrobium gellanilyticum]|uniref:ACS family tartrate transporter-like MFS transporter n=2 Tax=Roseimicrobium gellanilyticum TaxID=748857 RepID=A0A366HBV6_9BACT|nr:ACS family tartrate transporter-like MFS transporter [Roseimicrobium gellanilyticum]